MVGENDESCLSRGWMDAVRVRLAVRSPWWPVDYCTRMAAEYPLGGYMFFGSVGTTGLRRGALEGIERGILATGSRVGADLFRSAPGRSAFLALSSGFPWRF